MTWVFLASLVVAAAVIAIAFSPKKRRRRRRRRREQRGDVSINLFRKTDAPPAVDSKAEDSGA